AQRVSYAPTVNRRIAVAALAGPFNLGILCALCIAASASGSAGQRPSVRIEIDAGRIEGRISPLLYGQFIEFMFEGVKRGLHAELIRNRSFDEEPGAIGLSRYWERYPDDRNDDYGMSFSRDTGAANRRPGPTDAT